MNLKNILEIGISLGAIKFWTTFQYKSPFSSNLQSQLESLKEFITELSEQSDTLTEIDDIIAIITDAFITEGSNVVREEIDKIKDRIVKAIFVWQDRFRRELAHIHVIRLLNEGNLNPDKLSKGARSFINAKIWKKMDKIEREDLDDGCRCLSIQAWTPASMITMRVVESVLRAYYQKITALDPKGKMWSNILNELRTAKSTEKTLIGYLDYLREIRNKLQHPDARLDQFEAGVQA